MIDLPGGAASLSAVGARVGAIDAQRPLATSACRAGTRSRESCLQCDVHISIAQTLAKYVPGLKKLAVVRLLQQLSQFYKTIKSGVLDLVGFTHYICRLERLRELVPDLPPLELENFMMMIIHHDLVSARLDHRLADLSKMWILVIG